VLVIGMVLVACSPARPSEDVGGVSPSVSGTTAVADWQVLFDGAVTDGLRGYGADTFPTDSWVVEDGLLRTVPGRPLDLITVEAYADFELEFTWQVSPGGNSGIIYRVEESAQPAWTSGPEYQVLDDALHPDGGNARTSAGSLYDLIEPAPSKVLAPAGEENTGRIVIRDSQVEHWLNGESVVSYAWRDADVLARIAASKFRDLRSFMATDEGHVVIQHHGEEVAYALIRIRRL
jgi:hypothetical protein